jgi:hypothetical protein
MDATAGHRRADRIAFDAASNARQRSCASKSGFQRSAAYEPAGRDFRIRVFRRAFPRARKPPYLWFSRTH